MGVSAPHHHIVCSPSIRLRRVQILEAQKGPLGIVEYSYSQSTLERVFLRFAQQQEDGEILS